MLFRCTDQGESNSEQVETKENGIWRCPPPDSTGLQPRAGGKGQLEAAETGIRNESAASSGLSTCLVESRRNVPANRRAELSFRALRLVSFSSNRSPVEVVRSCSTQNGSCN